MLNKTLVLAVLGILLHTTGCETGKQSPVGSQLVGRRSGGIVELPAVPLSGGSSFVELIAPTDKGGDANLLVGRMNGLLFRSLLRFRVPADSLALASGGTGAADFQVDSLSIILGINRLQLATGNELRVHRPETIWTDTTFFVDPVTFQEIDFLSSPIEGTQVTVLDASRLRIDVPLAYFADAQGVDPQNPTVDFLLNPEDEDFLIALISEESQAFGTETLRPQIEVVYTVGTDQARFEAGVSEDTYMVEREGEGPPTDLFLVSKGHFYSSMLKFDIPPTIPKGATINSAVLEVDLDLDRSFLQILPFELHLVDLQTSPLDTTFTAIDQTLQFETGIREFPIPPSLIQGWVSGTFDNDGLAFRARALPPDMMWLVLKAVRLRIIYSLPPEF